MYIFNIHEITSLSYKTNVKAYCYVKIVYSKYMKCSSELLAYLRPWQYHPNLKSPSYIFSVCLRDKK